MTTKVQLENHNVPRPTLPISTMVIRGETEGFFVKRSVIANTDESTTADFKHQYIEVFHLEDITKFTGMDYQHIEAKIRNDSDAYYFYSAMLEKGWYQEPKIEVNTWCAVHGISPIIRETLFWSLALLCDLSYGQVLMKLPGTH